MLDRLISLIAPHPCASCGRIGAELCLSCKDDIINDVYAGCLNCAGLAGVSGICSACVVPYSQAWCVGERSGSLKTILDNYKFERMQSAARTLAILLDDTVPMLPSETVIVPVPTSSSHRRQRGYDQVLLIAKYFAARRNLAVERLLVRMDSKTQRDMSRVQREEHAKNEFRIKAPITSTRPYLVIDDIVTTGATMKAATRLLVDAGATIVWAAAVARQPSTK